MDKNKLSRRESDIRKVETALSMAKASTIQNNPVTRTKTVPTPSNPKISDISTITKPGQPPVTFPPPVAGSSAGVYRGKHPHPDTPAEGKKVSATVQSEPKRAKRGE